MGHIVFIIPGLGDNTWIPKVLTRHWNIYGLTLIIHSMNWIDPTRSFEEKLNVLIRHIDEHSSKKHTVSLVGTSAGGSAVLNAYIQRKHAIKKVVNICGRLSVGPTKGYRSFQNRTHAFPSFAQSIQKLEQQQNTLALQDRKNIMTVSSSIYDDAVPSETSVLSGAMNITLPTIGHIPSIGLAFTANSGKILDFITS